TARTVRGRRGRARHGQPLRHGRGPSGRRDHPELSDRQPARAGQGGERGTGGERGRRSGARTPMTRWPVSLIGLTLGVAIVVGPVSAHTGGSTGYAVITVGPGH